MGSFSERDLQGKEFDEFDDIMLIGLNEHEVAISCQLCKDTGTPEGEK